MSGRLAGLIPLLSMAMAVATAETSVPGAAKSCPYQSQHEAAFAALNTHNPQSVRNNTEYGGYIYVTEGNGYCFTKPVQGDFGRVDFQSPQTAAPANSKVTASWHTHGAAMEGVISEIFSPQDMRFNQFHQLDGYLATPSGALKFISLGSKTTSLLGSVATR